jgi:chromosome segregation ATPase
VVEAVVALDQENAMSDWILLLRKLKQTEAKLTEWKQKALDFGENRDNVQAAYDEKARLLREAEAELRYMTIERDSLTEDRDDLMVRLIDNEHFRLMYMDIEMTCIALEARVEELCEDRAKAEQGEMTQKARAEKAEAELTVLKTRDNTPPNPNSPEWEPWVKTVIGRCPYHSMELTRGSWHMHVHCPRERY